MSKIQQQQGINKCLSFANKNTNANTNSNTNANENTNWLKNTTACSECLHFAKILIESGEAICFNIICMKIVFQKF